MKDKHVEIYNAYCRDPQNDHCELAFYLGATWPDHKYKPQSKGYDIPAEKFYGKDGEQKDCAHHIFHVGWRPNLKSNLIRISPEAHHLVHFGCHGEPIYIPILCVLAKLIKLKDTGSPDEFTIAEIDAAAGKSVYAVIEHMELDDYWDVWRQKCLRELERLEIGA